MKYQENKPDSASRLASESNLRRNAEAQLLSKQQNALLNPQPFNSSTPQPIDLSTLQPLNSSTPPLSDTDTQKLIHELQVHQIELEMQNEELMLTIEQAEIAKTKLEVIAEIYAELYDFGPLGFFTLSKTGIISELNLSGAEILGNERLKITNSPFVHFVSTYDKPIFNRFLDKVFSSKGKENCELQLTTDAGILSYVYLSGKAIENNKECLITAFDISKSRQGQERARQSAMISLLLNSIPDLVFYKDTEGIYLGCNPKFAEFVGKSMDDITGKTDFDLFDKEVAAFFRHHDTEMLKQKKPLHNEEWVTWSDGRKVLLDTFKAPFCDANGILIGILGVSRDITERQAAEIKIKENEVKFNSIFNNSPSLMVLANATDKRVVEINDSFLQKTGLLREDVIGKTIGEVPAFPIPNEQQRISQVLDEKGRISGMELQLKAKSGDIIYGVFSREPIDIMGRPYFITSITDITDLKKAENKLHESEMRFAKLEEHSRVMTWEVDAAGLFTFISPVVTAILGYKPDEIIGKKHFYDCILRKNVNRLRKQLSRYSKIKKVSLTSSTRQKQKTEVCCGSQPMGSL